MITVNAFTIIGAFSVSYWLVFKFFPWLEGSKRYGR